MTFSLHLLLRLGEVQAVRERENLFSWEPEDPQRADEIHNELIDSMKNALYS